MTCNETLFDVITSIEAYPFDGVSSTRTMTEHNKFVNEDELALDKSSMQSVPMKPKSCSPDEKPGLEISGDSYEVTVSWNILFMDNDTYRVLKYLHDNPNHLILRTYSGKGYFIRCEEEAYSFSYMEKKGLMECELKIHNKSGIQRIL